MFEQIRQRAIELEFLLQSRVNPRQPQGVPADVEKVGVAAEIRMTEDLSPDAGNLLFQFAGSNGRRLCSCGRGLHLWECSAVDLAVGIQRKLFQRDQS